MSLVPRISVVTPTYRRCSSVRRVLESMQRQTLSADDFEVVLVIDGSDDGTLEMAKAFPALYDLTVHFQQNAGRAAACNAGIRRARGQIVVLLDDDMEPSPQLLEAHEQAHAVRSRVGVLGAVPVSYDATSPPLTRYIGSRFDEHLRLLAQREYSPRLREFYTGNFSIRKELLLEVGGFDETFRTYGHEDFELAIRLQKVGVRFVYRSDAVARQHYSKNFAALAHDSIAEGRNSVYLARKHSDASGELKLATRQEGPLSLRLLRDALLALADFWTGFPWLVVRATEWLEAIQPGFMNAYYPLAQGFFYWIGVRDAMREMEAKDEASADFTGAPGGAIINA